MTRAQSREKIRVVFVDHTAQLGGGEIALRNLLRNLHSTRIEASVVLCADGPLVEQLRMHHPVHILPIARSIGEVRKDSIGWKMLLKGKSLISVLSYILKLSAYLRKVRPDLLHTNSMKAHVVGGIAGWLAGIPVVWHMRDRVAPDYLPAGAVRFVRLLSKVIPRFIIANSFATLNTVVQPGTIGNEREEKRRFGVVHDGCEVPDIRFKPIQDSPMSIGLIGRISPWKGQHVFIRAAAMTRDEFPNVRFQIIGAPLFSEIEYENELKRLASELELDGRVVFTGFVHDVQAALEKMHIVVHASTVGEPFGQVVIEGMAAGKPVVATNGGGIPEIVVDQMTGLLVEMNNPRALADAMSLLLRDPARARAMGACGRERVQKLFTIEHTAAGVEQVYRELLLADRTGVREAERTYKENAQPES